MSLRVNIALIIFTAIVLMSCSTHNLMESKFKQSEQTHEILMDSVYVYHVRKDDKISVSIWGHDDLSVGSIFSIYNSNEVYGKWVLVDENGFVILPKIGKVQAEGLTIKELVKKLEERYSTFIIDPVISVKILNREVTVLGEVRNQGPLLLEKETNTVYEILGRAGGLEFYANKKNIQLIRGGIAYSLDLTQDVQHIVVRPNDIIHVPTRKGKMIDKKAPTIIPFTSAITALAVIVSFLNK